MTRVHNPASVWWYSSSYPLRLPLKHQIEYLFDVVLVKNLFLSVCYRPLFRLFNEEERNMKRRTCF